MNHLMLLDPEADPRIAKLFAYGHFSNPAYPETQNVTEDDLHLLDLHDEVVKQAAQSYQQFFQGDLDRLCEAFHSRPCNPDGDIGVATSKLLDMPRCGVPEYAGAEEANWPDACRNQITVSYLFDSINATLAAQSWALALKSWVDRIALNFELQDTFSQNTRIWATDGALPGSTLAWSYLAQNNCNARLEQRYDTTVNWNLTFLQSTICHEVGHALGLNHINTRAAIMYPSISNIIVPGEPDIAAMLRLGYQKRTTPVPPPEDPTTPVPGSWTGMLTNTDGKSITLIGISA